MCIRIFSFLNLQLFIHFISVLQVSNTTLVAREATHSLPPGNPSRAQRIPMNAGPAPHWATSAAEPCQRDFPSGYLSENGIFASCGCPPWSAQPASQLWPRVKQPPGRRARCCSCCAGLVQVSGHPSRGSLSCSYHSACAGFSPPSTLITR